MFLLKVKERKLFGRKTDQLRKAGFIPAIIYGHGVKNQAVEAPYIAFDKIFQETGESGLIDLEIDDKKPIKVLVHDIDYHPLTQQIQHIDFYQIKAGEKISVEVEIKFVGVAPAVKELGGIFVPNLAKIEIECLPEDLVRELEVDISKLAAFGDSVRVSDIAAPQKIKILNDPAEVIATIEEPRAEEELKKMEEAPVEKPEEVKVEEKGKIEEEGEGKETMAGKTEKGG